MEQLGLGLDFDLSLTLAGFPENVTVVAKGTPIFRLDMEELPYINLKEWLLENQKEKEWFQKGGTQVWKRRDQIWEDFWQVEIRVAEVKEVERVEGSDKLLRCA